jgi:hypothetical protein
MRFTPLAAAILASALTLLGQPISPDDTNHDDLSEFSADRPGFGVPTNVLPRSVVQLESGFGVTSEANRNTFCRTLTWGSPLARMGVGHRSEIRFGGDGFLSSRTEGVDYLDRARGWSDFGVGAKIAIFNGHGIWPALSLLPTLSLPVGGDAFTSSAIDPNIILAWSANLPAKLSAGGTMGYASVSDGPGRLAQRTLAASLGHSLVAGLSGYAEIYNVSHPARAVNANWMLDGGVTHAVGRNAAIDAEVGRKFVSDKSCWFVSFGFAIRTTALRHLLGPPR